MYISDKDALQYASRLILILVPFFSSLFDTWSWIVEILLLIALFIHSRSSGLRLTAICLAAGYIAALIPAGGGGMTRMGFSPWAGILLLGLKQRGLNTAQSMFWALIAAALVSALPIVPMVGEMLHGENIQKTITSALQYYEQQGTLQALEKRGMNIADLEKYLRSALPVYYQLLPAIAGIIGMLELGIAFLVYRISLRKVQKSSSFALFRLPWYAVWFAIFGLASYLGGDYLGVNIFKLTGMNVMTVMGAISLLQGFSCLSYLFKHPKTPRMLIWSIIFAGIFFPYFLLVGVAFLGLFDPVLNFRRIPEKTEGGKI